MNKATIAIVGEDTVGVTARVCTYLADNQINILDISQTIVQGYFNMMMTMDVGAMIKSFGLVSGELERTGEKIGVEAKIQREDIFTRIYRI